MEVDGAVLESAGKRSGARIGGNALLLLLEAWLLAAYCADPTMAVVAVCVPDELAILATRSRT